MVYVYAKVIEISKLAKIVRYNFVCMAKREIRFFKHYFNEFYVTQSEKVRSKKTPPNEVLKKRIYPDWETEKQTYN